MERASHVLLTYLVNSAWQVTAICVMAALGSLLLRRTRASHRHTLWLAALVLSTLLPILSVRGISTEQPSSTIVPDNAEPTIQTTVFADIQPPQSRFHLPHISPMHISSRVGWGIGACYTVFLLYRIAALLIAARRTRALRGLASGPVTDSILKTVVDRYSAALGMRHAPAVYLTEGIGPVTLGIRRPILLLPASFAASASEPEMISAVCHELAHIRRHDFLLNLACELACLPVFFHPAAILIKTRIDSSRELACDDMAAEIMSAPAVYARSLLSIAKSMSSSVPVRKLGYGQGLFDTKKMEERIMNLVGNRKLIGEPWARAWAAGAVALLAAVSLSAATLSLKIAPRTNAATVATATAPAAMTAKQDAASMQDTGTQGVPAQSRRSERVSIQNFTLIGGTELPDAEEQLAKELKGHTYGPYFRSEIPERVREFYREYGYFKARVTESNVKQAGPSTVDVTVTVNSGQQYRLEDIKVSGAKLFPESGLRALFPLQPGEVFKSSSIRKGFEATRRLYVGKSYTNAVLFPDLKINDSARTILLNIAIDEGEASSSASSPASGQRVSTLWPGYYRVGTGIDAPHATYTPEPSYDPISRAAKSQGTAIYLVGLGSDGKVEKLQFVRSRDVSGGELAPGLIQKGLESIQQWRFEPALKDGQPVPVQINVEVNFRLY